MTPRRRRLAVAALAGLVLLRRRRRARSASGRAQELWAAGGPADADATVPAVPGRLSSVLPAAERLRALPPYVAGEPRLDAVLGGTLPHDEVAASADLQVHLPAGRLVVGRDPSADVRLDDPTVSPRHALLEVESDGRVHVRDLGALNGVLVDGVPVVRRRLNDGDRIELGEAALVFRSDPPEDDGGRQGGELGEQPHHREQGRD